MNPSLLNAMIFARMMSRICSTITNLLIFVPHPFSILLRLMIIGSNDQSAESNRFSVRLRQLKRAVKMRFW